MCAVNIRHLQVGDSVVVRTRDRGQVIGKINEIAIPTADNPEGIKNGIAGISYDYGNDDGGWCYDYQIVGRA